MGQDFVPLLSLSKMKLPSEVQLSCTSRHQHKKALKHYSSSPVSLKGMFGSYVPLERQTAQVYTSKL